MFPQFVHHMFIHSLKAIIYAQNLRPINLRRRCLVRWSLMMLRFGISAMSLVMKSPRSPSRTCIGDTTFNKYIYSNNRIYEYSIYLAQWFKLHGWVYNPFYNTCQEPPGSSVAQLNPASTDAMEEMVSAIPDPQWAMSMLEQCLHVEWTNMELTQDCQGLKPYTIDVSIVWHAHSQWEFLMVLFWMGVAVGILRVAKLRSLFLRGVEVTDEITKRLSSHEPAPTEAVFWSGQLQHFYFCLLNLLYWWTPIKHYMSSLTDSTYPILWKKY